MSDFNEFFFIDLTHPLHSLIPTWDGNCGFLHQNVIDYPDSTTEVKFRVQRISMQAGIGTHIDAPAHCIEGGLSVADIPLSQLIAPCIVMDVSKYCDADYSLSSEEVLHFENQNGRLGAGNILLIYTGWEKYWNDPEQYRNNFQFPSISEECAHLLSQRKLAGVGIDTLGVDRPDSGYPSHCILLGSGIFIVENVASILQMPMRGGYVMCLPMKGQGLTEAPARIIGISKWRSVNVRNCPLKKTRTR